VIKFNGTLIINTASLSGISAIHQRLDDLLAVLNKYIEDDATATDYGDGCYGYKAEAEVMKMLKTKSIGEYLSDDQGVDNESTGS